MTTRIVDDLARLAADAEAPALDDSAANRMIARALYAPHVAPVTKRSWTPAILATCAAAMVIAVFALRTQPVPAPELLHVALPTGDHLVGTNAQFDVVKLERANRRLELHSGTLLADVAHVAPGQRFVIATAHLVATARGTVFSVETDALRTRVRVYEGVVEIAQGDDTRMLASGTMWSSDARALAIAPERPRAFAAEIAQVIEKREATAVEQPAVVAVVPAPPPPPAPPQSVIATAHVVSPVASEPDLDTLLARAHAELAKGHLDAALAITEAATKRGAMKGAWRVLAADALRGLGRAREAADAYELAASELSGVDAVDAGYEAAYLRFKDLQDYSRALDVLVASHVDTEDSPLEERGLALHWKILVAANRRADATAIAVRYLARFPNGELRAEMQSLLK